MQLAKVSTRSAGVMVVTEGRGRVFTPRITDWQEVSSAEGSGLGR